jgi:hypothetical protein
MSTELWFQCRTGSNAKHTVTCTAITRQRVGKEVVFASLTPWRIVIVEHLIVAQQVEKFLTFYGV